MSDLSERYGKCAECGEYAIHLAWMLFPEFTGDDEDMLEGVSVYANEAPPVGDELLAHICFKCGHTEDVGNRQFCEREHVWTSEWPTEPGMYWFFGYVFLHHHQRPTEPRMVTVRASRSLTSSDMVFFAEQKYMFDGECIGLWSPANLPKPPLSQLEALL